jgi:acid phosphatase type 7
MMIILKNKNILITGLFLIIITHSSFSQKITRGPYLQMPTPTSMMIRWRTDIAVPSKISYGLSKSTINASKSDDSPKTEHLITINNLTPNTKYLYIVETDKAVLQSSTDNFFVTNPIVGSEQKVSIWALGDMGMGTEAQTRVYQQYLKYTEKTPTNLWLLLGDNAYGQGLDWEFQLRFFEYYQVDRLMKQTVLMPSPGNHDYSPTENNYKIEDPLVAYFNIFSVPTKGEAGGVPSGSKAYYSYDYANIHFISLDSYGREDLDKRLFSKDSQQMIWLEKDLKANKQKWTITYWHHPPYTMGSHNSDTEDELRLLREGVVPLLEKYKVDLVLNGHSHNYERSQMIKGHYGLEATFNQKTHGVSTSTGRYDSSKDSCPYIKDSQKTDNEGIIYVVNGVGGSNGGGQSTYPHDAMIYSNNINAGSMYLEIEGNRLDAKFITEDGSIMDQFTILKDVNQKQVLKLEANQNTIPLQASWKGSFNWQHDNSKNKTVQVSPIISTKYIVQDDQKCLQDEFTVKVASAYSLKDFNLTVTKSGMAIDWLTVQERGIVSFEIERQRQGSEFKSIIKINSKAKGQFSDKSLSYRYLDHILESNESVSYRIKVIDNEGLIYYSPVKSVSTTLKVAD